MLAAHWLEIPITWSLAIVGMILGICAVASMLAPVRQKGHGSAGTEKREEGKRAS